MFFLIILLELFNLLPIDAQFPHFVTLPQTRVVNEEEDVIFKCEATPHTELEYSWMFNENPIKISLRVQQVGSNLQVLNVRRGIDSGKYVCIATHIVNGTSLTSPGADLYIKPTPKTSVQLIQSDRNKVVLKCYVENVNNNDLFNYEWFFNNGKLKSLKNIVLKDHFLLIRRPNIHNNGLYLCNVTNSIVRIPKRKGYLLKYSDKTKCKSFCSNTTTKFELVGKNYRIKRNVSKTPLNNQKLPIATDISIIEGPSGKKIIQENYPIDLPCRANIPKHYIERGSLKLLWHKDNKILRQTQLGIPLNMPDSKLEVSPLQHNDSRISINKHNGSLKFSHVISSDMGQYFCQINIQGYSPITSDIMDLEVIEQLRFLPQPTSKNLELGSVGKIHCKAQGTPTPKIKWIRETLIPDEKITFDDVNGTLVFKNVTFDHRGNYTCIANNLQGEINATVTINVVVAPRFTWKPEGPIEVAEMGTVSMHCQAIGDPKPTIQWDKDLQYLSENNTDNRFTFLKNGTLVIREVHLEDEGRYGCTIGNSAGLKRVEVQFIVGITDDDDSFPITRAVLITMSAAFAYIILVVGLMIWCRVRRQAQKSRSNVDPKDNLESGENTCKAAENDPCLPLKNSTHTPMESSKVKTDKNKIGKCKTEMDKSESSNIKDSRKSLNIEEQTLLRSDINELIKLGRGEFGEVFVGKIKASILTSFKNNRDSEEQLDQSDQVNRANAGTSGSEKHSMTSIDAIEEIKEEDLIEISSSIDESKLVLVKAFSKTKDEISYQEFQRQIQLFHYVKHAGVVRFYGLCKERDPLYMVLEHTDWGDLKQFLLATAGKVNTSNSNNSHSLPPLKTAQILAVAYQIALGMDAIYRAKYTHKDLATRNCIISSDFVVKVSYAALSKDKYNREYFKHRNKVLPIRWMAPECIQEDEYSTKSDIFAYGVVVWELFNQATKIPFEDLSNEDFLQQSKEGILKWTCVENIPPSLHEIILSCWSENSKKRPSFSQLCTSLHQAMENGCK